MFPFQLVSDYVEDLLMNLQAVVHEIGLPFFFDSANVMEQSEEKNGRAISETLWTDGMIRLLIMTRISFETEFEKPIQKRKLWARISDVLKGEGYLVTGDECDVKWRNLLGTFRKNKDKANKHGEDAVRWKYFSLMNEGIGMTISLEPPLRTLLSSIKAKATPSQSSNQVVTTCSRSSSNCSMPPSPNIGSPLVTLCVNEEEVSVSHPLSSETSSPPPIGSSTEVKRKRRRLKRPTDETPLWFKHYCEEKREEERRREAKEDQKWKEHAELEREKIAALNALIDMLRKK